MHYFQFNIKDYHFATKHFNYVEHGAYLVLMSVLYETEKPLTANINELIKTCMARNEEEINAIKYILENCFYLITYRKNIKFPQINPHVKHKSPRGGSMYSRYLNLVNKKSC